MASRTKPTVLLFLQRDSPSTAAITNHLNKHISALMLEITIQKTYVDQTNLRTVMTKYKVERTPCLIISAKQYLYKVPDIQAALTPRRSAVVTYGGATSPEEMIRNYYEDFTNKDTNMDEDDSGALNSDVLPAA